MRPKQMSSTPGKKLGYYSGRRRRRPPSVAGDQGVSDGRRRTGGNRVSKLRCDRPWLNMSLVWPRKNNKCCGNLSRLYARVTAERNSPTSVPIQSRGCAPARSSPPRWGAPPGARSTRQASGLLLLASRGAGPRQAERLARDAVGSMALADDIRMVGGMSAGLHDAA